MSLIYNMTKIYTDILIICEFSIVFVRGSFLSGTVQLFNLAGINVCGFCYWNNFVGINVRVSPPSSNSTIIAIEVYKIAFGI